ncbi:serine/threonine protein kinase Kin1p [Monosporozyma unispora]
MALQRERIIVPPKHTQEPVEVDLQLNKDKRIPRIMESVSDDGEENGTVHYNDQDPSQRNYKYESATKGERPENDSELKVNQLLLKDLSQDNEADRKSKARVKSISHPYNKNRLPSSEKVIPNKQNLKDQSSLNDNNNNNNNNNNGSNKNKPFYRTSLGDWVFQETVGAGSMGKVKLAKHNYTGDLCAIKVVNRATKNFLHKQQNLPTPKDKNEVLEREKKLQKEISRDKRTIREASLGQILCHPNICKLYEMCTLSNHFYMVFEYISGGQLLDYIIQHGSLKELTARRIARSIASALQYLHANNVVHRDLKIENVMITKNGEIKLIDFGLSNLYNKAKHLHTFCGSLYFAAPELLKAQPYVGPEIDIWSFGVILYVLVCGKVPFDDENSSVLHEKIKRGKVTYPSFLSIEIISLLTRMLVINPQNRATLKEVVNHHWMIHGYNGQIPDSHLHWRAPLTPSNIENKVLNEMYHLEFIDDIPQTRKRIIDIIKREAYIELSIEHEKLYSYAHFNVNANIDIGFDDPLMGYHPLLSIYYLTAEWLERHENMSKEGKNMNKLIQDVTHIDEEPIETKSEPVLKPTSKQIEIKTNNHSKTKPTDNTVSSEDKKNTVTTATIKDGKGLDRPRHILIPPKLTAKAKVYTSPTRKNHFDPSDNAIPTVSTVKNNTDGGNRASNIANQDKNKIGNLLRRFSVKVTPTHKNDNINTSLNQKSNMTNHINNLKKSLELQNKHNRTLSENDGTTMKIMDLLDNNNVKKDNTNNRLNVKDYGILTADGTNNADNKENVQFIESNTRPSTGNSRINNKTRTMSVGHARRESLKFLRPVLQNNEEAIDSNVFLEPPPYENVKSNNNDKNNESMRKDDVLSVINTNQYSSDHDLSDSEIIEEAKKAPLGTMPSIDFPRSLFLKGFFSVQTTSSKPLPIVRYKIIRVLQKKNIQFKEVKGGFICTYQVPNCTKTVVKDETEHPNILSDKVLDLPSLTDDTNDIPNAIADSKSDDTCQDTIAKSTNEMTLDPGSSSSDPPPTTYSHTTSDNQPNERVSTINSSTNAPSSSSSTFANISEPLHCMSSEENDVSIRVMERPIVKFEIHIVKVKIINLAGIHFKKVTGNTWIYKDLASKILRDLKL